MRLSPDEARRAAHETQQALDRLEPHWWSWRERFGSRYYRAHTLASNLAAALAFERGLIGGAPAREGDHE